MAQPMARRTVVSRHNSLNEILAFMAVADGGSFVAGGRALGLTGSAAGKAVARLESRLGRRLFHRTTRAIALTDDGRRLYDHGLRVLEALDQAEAGLAADDGMPRGRLRLTLPDAFGRIVVLPLVRQFLQRWPEVRIEISLTDRPVDIVEEGFDLAVRIGGAGAPAGLICRTIASHRTMLCAAPAYLAARGMPAHADALARHDCLLFHSRNRTQRWRHRDAAGTWQRIPAGGRLRLDSGEALRDAAVAGLGIAFLPEFLVAGQIAAGDLQEVLPDLDFGAARIVALYPGRRLLEPRVRRFIDLLVHDLGD